MLGFFKYFNFFAESLHGAVRRARLALDFVTLHVVLPIGISFYTFMTMSYVIDVYRREIEPTRNLLEFARVRRVLPAPGRRARSCARRCCCRRSTRPRTIDARADPRRRVADLLGLLQEDGRRRQPRRRRQHRVRAADRIDGGVDVLLGDLRLRVPDLRRLLGLLGHRARHRRS